LKHNESILQQDAPSKGLIALHSDRGRLKWRQHREDLSLIIAGRSPQKAGQIARLLISDSWALGNWRDFTATDRRHYLRHGDRRHRAFTMITSMIYGTNCHSKL
jgi:hypothetical protein